MTERKERAMLYSPPMVQAKLDGRKTVTRRIVTGYMAEQLEVLFQEDEGIAKMFPRIADVFKPEIAYTQWSDEESNKLYGPEWVAYSDEEDGCIPLGQGPGKPGDLLWVREEHFRFGYWMRNGLTEAGKLKWRFEASTEEFLFPGQINVFRISRDQENPGKEQWYKRLSRFMPKSGARIWEVILSVRIERLQDITAEDAIAEGLAKISKDNGITFKYGIPDKDGMPGNDDTGWNWQEWEIDPRLAFRTLWNKIHGPESWELNPFVWRIETKLLSTNGYPKFCSVRDAFCDCGTAKGSHYCPTYK